MCPGGFYCNATSGPVIIYGSYICPEGYYCPNGTEYAEQYPCPRGTFNNLTGEIRDSMIYIYILECSEREEPGLFFRISCFEYIN